MRQTAKISRRQLIQGAGGLGLAVLAAACAPAAPAAPAVEDESPAAEDAEPAPAARQVLTLAQARAIQGAGPSYDGHVG
jgi:hypothetical protein